MIKKEKFVDTGLYEAPYIIISGNLELPYMNLLRIIILGHIPKAHMNFNSDQFQSTDTNIRDIDLLTQFTQIHVDERVKNLSFYVENKTYDRIQYGTFNLLMDGKPFNLADYNISNYPLGYLNSGCYVNITNIDLVYDTKFTSAFSPQWINDGKSFKFRTHDETIVSKAIDYIIKKYESYKGLLVWKNDEGCFAHIITDEGFSMGYNIKSKRTYYTDDIYTTLEGDQKIIDKIIDQVIQKFKSIK